jgi:hypothetical protein
MSSLRRSVAFAAQLTVVPVPKNRRVRYHLVRCGRRKADRCVAKVRVAPASELLERARAQTGGLMLAR